MILVTIELENYKQYVGSSRIEFPREGIVAITGANGAGKTTLFEAIEWCLYCPRSISQASIPPHEGVGKTVVRLTLEDEQDGKRYTVVRELRGSGTRAEVYAEEEPWAPLVQGTREVTQFVARKLVGLAHNAFVSTFFTKQRELQMFGDLRPTDRRVEVARLLGLEAVREAQNQIGEGRTASRTLADARRAEYERRVAGRNLEEEAADAAAHVVQAEHDEQEANAQLKLASETAGLARTRLEAQRELQGRDASLQQAFAAEATKLARANAQFDASTRELARLDQRAADRVQMLALAEALPTLEHEVAHLEAERSRAEQATRLRDKERQAREATIRVARRLQTLLGDHAADADGLMHWTWGTFDETECVSVAEEVGHAIADLDVHSLHWRLEAMQRAVQQQQTISAIDQKLIRYRDFRDRLQRERDALLVLGEPEEIVSRANQAVIEARSIEQRERLALARTRDDLAATQQLVQTLREHQHAAICPTCTRPLTSGEVDRMIEAVAPRLRELEATVKARSISVASAEREVAAAMAQEQTARSAAEKLGGLIVRIQDGEKIIQETEAQGNEASAMVGELLRQLGLHEAPDASCVDQARARAERAQRIVGIEGMVRNLGEQARDAIVTADEAKAQLAELGEITFDADAMRTATERLQESRKAAAQVEQIDVELAHRCAYERDRSNSEAEIHTIKVVQGQLDEQRKAVGYDPEVLAAAQRLELEARETADTKREAASHARNEAREARSARERLASEAEALRQLLDEADAHEREADELMRMYDEFREFDRYVARQVGPLLAESTERMLGHVTNGKFDQVQFDENYGIEIFDGDQPFPMSSFSGGERDVVALCARLALSEIVGSAALRPPRFLVLDEVFGSLDSDRRAQLLEMLGSLASSGYFRQMFIVSHVDDVQQSPVMTEAWRIEDIEGVSRVVRPNAIAA